MDLTYDMWVWMGFVWLRIVRSSSAGLLFLEFVARHFMCTSVEGSWVYKDSKVMAVLFLCCSQLLNNGTFS
jgi:hypothetical protein